MRAPWRITKDHWDAADEAGFGAFVTALYTFRQMYLTFHGKERFTVVSDHGHGHDHHDAHDEHHDDHGHHEPGVLHHAPKESPWVVTLPLILLAIPSLLIGAFGVGPMLFGNWFGSAIHVQEGRNVLEKLAEEIYREWLSLARAPRHSLHRPPS